MTGGRPAGGQGGEAAGSTYEDYMARADDGTGGPRERGDDWEWSLQHVRVMNAGTQRPGPDGSRPGARSGR